MGIMCLNECIYQILQNVSIFRRYRKSLMYMQLMLMALPSHRQFFCDKIIFKNRIEILYLLILVMKYQGYFLVAAVNYGCNLLFMHLQKFLNETVDKKCGTPNKLLLLSLLLFLWSFISNFLCSILKNRELTTTTSTNLQ